MNKQQISGEIIYQELRMKDILPAFDARDKRIICETIDSAIRQAKSSSAKSSSNIGYVEVELLEWIEKQKSSPTKTHSEMLQALKKKIISISSKEESKFPETVEEVEYEKTGILPKQNENKIFSDEHIKSIIDKLDDIFDLHTAPTGGGYEADYTSKQDVLNDFEDYLKSLINK